MLRFYVHKLHWIRLTFSVKKLLKLNLPEIIQVLLPTKNTIYAASKWLENSGYIINQWKFLIKEQAIMWFKKLGGTEKVIMVG